MALSAQANIPDGVKTQGFLVHFNAPGDPHQGAQHIVVEQQAFRAHTQQTGVHAGSFINDVGSGKGSGKGR